MALFTRAYTQRVGPSFTEHVELLAGHGQLAVTRLAGLPPKARLAPDDATAHKVAHEHWATVEIWSWSLEHRSAAWDQREAPAPPSDHASLLAGIAAEHARLVTLLQNAGPDGPIDYFGQPGTCADLARLLAHETITLAHAATAATGQPWHDLTPQVASDGVRQALSHWSSADPQVAWRQQPVAVHATDTGDEWYLAFPVDVDEFNGEYRLVAAAPPVAVLEGPAEEVLWWLHGWPIPDVSAVGAPEELRLLRQAFLQPDEPRPRRKWRWFS